MATMMTGPYAGLLPLLIVPLHPTMGSGRGGSRDDSLDSNGRTRIIGVVVYVGGHPDDHAAGRRP